MGYVYYGHYALYYEEARTDAIRKLGVSYKKLEEIGIMMPVMELNVTYLRPAFYDDLLTVHCSIKEVTPEDKEIVFHGEIFNEKGKKLNVGIVRLAFVDMNTKRKTTIPPILYDALIQHFQ